MISIYLFPNRPIASLATSPILAHVHKTLKFRDVAMTCVNGGAIDTVQVGMFGVIGQMQREEGAKKTKRGMMGVFKSGRNAGGKCYGYATIPGQPGELSIVEEEAAVIRRIFEMFAGGVSPRSIAAVLNEEGVPAPRSTRWNTSTIMGTRRVGAASSETRFTAGSGYGTASGWSRTRRQAGGSHEPTTNPK